MGRSRASVSVRDTDRGMKAMLKRLQADVGELTIGIHEAEGALPKESDEGAQPDVTLLDVAIFHEFGTTTVPRRSFIGDWADENRAAHEQQLRKMAKAIVQGKVASPEVALGRLGSLYVAEVQKRIADGIEPELAQSTIDRKGSSKSLIDTGQLRTSIAPYVNGRRIE